MTYACMKLLDWIGDKPGLAPALHLLALLVCRLIGLAARQHRSLTGGRVRAAQAVISCKL